VRNSLSESIFIQINVKKNNPGKMRTFCFISMINWLILDLSPILLVKKYDFISSEEVKYVFKALVTFNQ
jgi:hypothetical protein